MSDGYVLLGVQTLLASVFIVAVLEDLKRRSRKKQMSSTCEMIRGNVSWGLLYALYASVWALLLQLINASAAWKGHKVLTSFVDTIVMGYLSFVSGWSRENRIGSAHDDRP